MAKIIPIKDLKDTTKLSNMVREEAGPVYVTKNGYGEMVVMSMDAYERTVYFQDVMQNLYRAEQDFAGNRVSDPLDTIAELKEKYGLSSD
ncbi:MAG: type II toxin-antitoxin system Phd/YefM family antitoxin [Clostridiales Family XIII bacterium]|nr:type II toxin-antitoxin system Phd/YefM family antitoxin [Clostridiales Family XIII bacterium]